MPTAAQLIEASLALIDELDATPFGQISEKLDKLAAMLTRAKLTLSAEAPGLQAALTQMVANSQADGKAYRDCHKAAVAAIAKAEGGAA